MNSPPDRDVNAQNLYTTTTFTLRWKYDIPGKMSKSIHLTEHSSPDSTYKDTKTQTQKGYPRHTVPCTVFRKSKAKPSAIILQPESTSNAKRFRHQPPNTASGSTKPITLPEAQCVTILRHQQAFTQESKNKNKNKTRAYDETGNPRIPAVLPGSVPPGKRHQGEQGCARLSARPRRHWLLFHTNTHKHTQAHRSVMNQIMD